MLVALEFFFFDSSSYTYYDLYNYLIDYNSLLKTNSSNVKLSGFEFSALFYMLSLLSNVHLCKSTIYSLCPYLILSVPTCNALLISFKFLFCISILIFVRGGIPRFRFDYLTKLG